MTIWELTLDALSGLEMAVASNVMMMATGQELPDVFAVYQLISSPPVQHAEDRETMRYYRMQVNVYSRNGLGGLPDVSGAMVDAGFTRGPMRELPYNPETRHFGLAMEFVFTSDEEDSESY